VREKGEKGRVRANPQNKNSGYGLVHGLPGSSIYKIQYLTIISHKRKVAVIFLKKDLN